MSGVLVRSITSALERAATGEVAIDMFPALSFASVGSGNICPKSSNRLLLLASPSDRHPGSAEKVGYKDWFHVGHVIERSSSCV